MGSHAAGERTKWDCGEIWLRGKATGARGSDCGLKVSGL